MRKLFFNALVSCALAACSASTPAPQAANAVPESAAAGESAAVGLGSAPAGNGTVTPELEAIVNAPERSSEDRQLDAGRHPAELLAFVGARPGMRVAEISAGGGYTAELLARAVGPSGAVYGMNLPFILQRYAEKPWTERLAKPVMKNVVRVDRPMDEPLPPDAVSLDAVINILFYHDLFWIEGDRAKMNAAILAALKPGGSYVIVDHSGRPGTGSSEVQTLHRIEEDVVKNEIIAAGFTLAGEADFLRNPSDTRDWSASPRFAGEKRGTSDRFVLRFVKP
jgi:predicted methyltransferase